jgi:hypothetical protein
MTDYRFLRWIASALIVSALADAYTRVRQARQQSLHIRSRATEPSAVIVRWAQPRPLPRR